MSSHISDDVLLQLVTRLEAAISTLETKSVGGNPSTSLITSTQIAVANDSWTRLLKLLLDFKQVSIDTNLADMETLSEIVAESICAHQDILNATSTFTKPVNNDQQSLSKKLFTITSKAAELGKKNRDIGLHCDAVKNGLDALYWVFTDVACHEITQTYMESIDFPGNKILIKKVPEQTAWLKMYKNIIKEINELVKANYKCGLVWASKGDSNVSNLILTIGNTYRNNYKQSGSNELPNTVSDDNRSKLLEAISTSDKSTLKPVVKEEKKVVEEKTEPNKKSNQSKLGRRETLMNKGKKEIHEEGKASFLFENLTDETRELDVNKLQNRTIIDLHNCSGCTFKIPKKVNAIKLSNCEGCNIMIESVISIVEVINCLKVKVGINGTVNSFTIDNSNDIILHASKNSANAQYYVSKCTDIHIRLQKEEDDGDYYDFTVPDQFVFTVNDKKKLDGKVSDLFR